MSSPTMVPLGDQNCFQLISGLWKGKKAPFTHSAVLRSTNFRGDGLLDYSDIAKLDVETRQFEQRKLSVGDIIIERSGGGPKQPVGRVGYFDPPNNHNYCTSNFTTALRVIDKKRFDPCFVSIYLQSLYVSGATETLQRATTGIRNLDWAEYLSFEIPEYDLDDQRAYARLLGKIRDSYIIEQRLIDNAQELKRATMRELFTRGLRGEKQKETEIGLVPESWDINPIKDICDIYSGGTPRKSVPEYWKGEIPWASGKDLKTPTLGDTIDHISQSGAENGSRIVPADTVLILVRGMGLAKDLPVAVTLKEMAFNQDVKALIPRAPLAGGLLRSAIYNGKDRLLSRIVPSAHGTMTLNLDDLENFLIGIPTDHDEAKEIQTVIESLADKIDLHKRKKTVLEELFKSLLHKLKTGEIRVTDLDLSALDIQEKERAMT